MSDAASGAPKEPQYPQDYLQHWADQAAKKVLTQAPQEGPVVVASGITPSGTVHIGNFREVITVDLVARALRDRGRDVRFIYSWDDFDVFRKVPADMPNQEMLHQHLRRSIVDVPDPLGKAPSYADANIQAFEQSLTPLGIAPEFIRQSKAYRAGNYAQGIRQALAHKDAIAAILNEHRKTPLADSWLPIAGFCDACGKDELRFEWDGDMQVTAHCLSCEHVSVTDLSKGGNVKLLWRIDWPMRWAYEKVAFEPGGKDHSSSGGSYDTGTTIAKQVYSHKAPTYVAYDFVRVKGEGGKISSSKGGVITVADALLVYEPTVLRWIFASYRPNTEFQISFDLDVIKIYEDFDRALRLAHQPLDGGKNDKKRQIARRTMQLAQPDHQAITPGQTPPFVAGFRALSTMLQIFDGDIPRTLAYYKQSGEVTNPEEEALLVSRAQCCWNWIDRFAPDNFRYRVRQSPVTRELPDNAKQVLSALVKILRDQQDDASARFPDLRPLCEQGELTPATFSPFVYDLLIDRERGPKMSTLIPAIGTARALELLEPSLG